MRSAWNGALAVGHEAGLMAVPSRELGPGNPLGALAASARKQLEDPRNPLGRQLQATSSSANLTDDPTFKWAIIAVCVTVGVLCLVCVGWGLYVVFSKKENKVTPDAGKEEGKGAEPGTSPENMQKSGQPQTLDMQKSAGGYYAQTGAAPTPPWEQTGSMPPGIMLAPQVPLNFQPYASNPRPVGAPPYERLLLISSRIYNPMKVAAAALPNVAVVVYDWKNFTFQELVRYIKKAIGTTKVESLAVVAPGNKPGCIALLDGSTTTPEKLQAKGELLQFWRVLSGCVAPSASNDGRRVDLLGCRVVEAPRDGAALLKELWAQTAVPFAAADDALGGYMLATFLEDPSTGALSLIGSTIQGIDIYFNRNELLGIQAGQPQAAGGPPPQQQQQQQQPQDDVFQRFSARVKALGYTLPDVFKKYDTDKTGQLTPPQVISMLKEVLPDASVLDVQHFQAMMDIDGNSRISLQEFTTCLQDNQNVHSQVKMGKDENALMQQLQEYLGANKTVLQDYFRQYDKDNSGLLDHLEVASLAQSIPDLTPDEQKFIISFLYQHDKNGDGKLSFEEMSSAVASFGQQGARPGAQAAAAGPSGQAFGQPQGLPPPAGMQQLQPSPGVQQLTPLQPSPGYGGPSGYGAPGPQQPPPSGYGAPGPQQPPPSGYGAPGPQQPPPSGYGAPGR